MSAKDIIFGSEGTSQADFERMAEINREIGLTAMLQGIGESGTAVHEKEGAVVEHA